MDLNTPKRQTLVESITLWIFFRADFILAACGEIASKMAFFAASPLSPRVKEWLVPRRPNWFGWLIRIQIVFPVLVSYIKKISWFNVFPWWHPEATYRCYHPNGIKCFGFWLNILPSPNRPVDPKVVACLSASHLQGRLPFGWLWSAGWWPRCKMEWAPHQ